MGSSFFVRDIRLPQSLQGGQVIIKSLLNLARDFDQDSREKRGGETPRCNLTEEERWEYVSRPIQKEMKLETCVRHFLFQISVLFT